jgi:hypothetical protein
MYTKIIDERIEFKILSFSNYKIKQIKRDLEKFITNGDLEKSCFFTSELICSGLFIELWNIIIAILGKNIYSCNIKLICYLDIKFEEFKQYINSGVDQLELRNSQNIRELFCELISILCLSNKNQPITRVKINDDELESFNISTKLKADKIDYANIVFDNDDPKECFIAVNELIYNINSVNPNKLLIFFWIEWILKFSKKIKKNKMECITRDYPVSDKNKKNIIFLVWDCIKTKECDNKLINKCIDSLINLFCIKYSPSCNNNRIYLLYLAANLVTSKNIHIGIPIVSDINIVQNIIKKNDFFYKQIKQNEQNNYSGGEGIDDGSKSAIDNSMNKINMVLGNMK